jgi:hypothetical protein
MDTQRLELEQAALRADQQARQAALNAEVARQEVAQFDSMQRLVQREELLLTKRRLEAAEGKLERLETQIKRQKVEVLPSYKNDRALTALGITVTAVC